jgi:hypothetical protein
MYRRLLPKSLKADGAINPDETEAYESLTTLDQSVLTRAGTIVMKLFYPFNPALITAETENLVVPSQMAVIRPRGNIAPEYIRYIFIPGKRCEAFIIKLCPDSAKRSNDSNAVQLKYGNSFEEKPKAHLRLLRQLR